MLPTDQPKLSNKKIENSHSEKRIDRSPKLGDGTDAFRKDYYRRFGLVQSSQETQLEERSSIDINSLSEAPSSSEVDLGIITSPNTSWHKSKSRESHQEQVPLPSSSDQVNIMIPQLHKAYEAGKISLDELQSKVNMLTLDYYPDNNLNAADISQNEVKYSKHHYRAIKAYNYSVELYQRWDELSDRERRELTVYIKQNLEEYLKNFEGEKSYKKLETPKEGLFLEKSQTERFFRSVSQGKRCPDVAVVLVTHVLPGNDAFIKSIADIARVAAIIPKPSSIHETSLTKINKSYNIMHLNRDNCLDTDFIAKKLNSVIKSTERVVLLDMGGYFAKNIADIKQKMNGQLIGVVEDTENGHQRYEHTSKTCELPLPIISVARSKLKEPEDFLVGQAIVFSAEAILRENREVLIDKRALVIGYGKIGRSIANTLGRRSTQTIVYDIDPVRQAEAFAHGYRFNDLNEALSTADIVFCATGNKALRGEDYAKLKNECYIATATSADDELDMSSLISKYSSTSEGSNLQTYQADSHRLHLLNNGKAVNFLHKGVVGSYIHLIQAEILKSMQVLSEAKGLPNTVQSLSKEEKANIARLWLENYKR